MTVVQLINPGAFGGIETVVTHLARALHQSATPSATVAVLDVGAPVPQVVDLLASFGAPVEVVRVRPRRYLEEKSRIEWALHRLSATVVHSHGYRMDVMSRVARRDASARWVTTLHGFCGGDLKNRFYEALQLRSVRRADRVIAVSDSIGARARDAGVNARQIVVLPNAIARPDFLSREVAREKLGLSNSRKWIGWVGRMSGEKDPELFVETLRAISDRSVSAVMIGDGPIAAGIRERHADLVESGRLVLAGVRPGAGAFMRALDALVLSSVTEGTPMVVLEAMQAGVPVVATSVGGLPVLLSDDAGVLVSERSATALSAAIVDILDDAQRAATVVQRATTRVQNVYALQPWIDRHLALYSELSSMNGRRLL